MLWFAYKLVSLSYWIQPVEVTRSNAFVVICLQISIFELLNTTGACLNGCRYTVVICLQISIFELLNTTGHLYQYIETELWFAYKLVSLSYWIQPDRSKQFQPHGLWFAYKLVSLSYWIQQLPETEFYKNVVICLQISIFELLNTTLLIPHILVPSCDLLTN